MEVCTHTKIVCLGIAAAFAVGAVAQAPPYVAPDQMALLKSPDPKLAANKKLVFDMWRTIIQGAHLEHAEKFFTESYIQHNPNVASGRDALITYMKNSRPRRELQPNITFPVVSIMAEGDLVLLATVSYEDDPTKPGEKYAGTHFDLFRIENGKIAEHWDSVPKDPKALKYDPNTQTEARK